MIDVGWLTALPAMAEQAAAQLGDEMFNALLPTCIARTGLAPDFDTTAFAHTLIDDSFFAPVAQVIALALKYAIAALQNMTSAIPDGLTPAQAKQILQAQTELHLPRQLALSIQHHFRLPAQRQLQLPAQRQLKLKLKWQLKWQLKWPLT